MIKISLSNASNGIIKKVVDTQFNGVNQKAEIVTVYEIDDDLDAENKFIRTVEFLEDISKDLGIDLGSEYSRLKVKMMLGWGDKYNPSPEEIDEHLSWLRKETKLWRDHKKIIQSTLDVNNG
jgi:hypothetical protein